MNPIVQFLDALGLAHPLTYLLLFLAASFLMIWRLESLIEHGLEGTALGTLVMPYCSGLGNLIFVVLLLRDKGSASEVMTNCLVNNTTNLTLLLGIPALIWGLNVSSAAAPNKGSKPKKSKKTERLETEKRLSRLSLLLTLAAVAFFTGAVWALGQDGTLDLGDGLVLVGIFLFWQCFHIFDVLKHNVKERHSFSLMFYVDLVVLLVGAVLLYTSLDSLVSWLGAQKSGFFSAKNLGWLTGWLMVLPNGVLALYYASRQRADVVYSSQVGDGHICIPLCLGLFAIFKPLPIPKFFETSMLVILGAAALHFFFVVLFGRLPRWVGAVLIAAYVWFVYRGWVA